MSPQHESTNDADTEIQIVIDYDKFIAAQELLLVIEIVEFVIVSELIEGGDRSTRDFLFNEFENYPYPPYDINPVRPYPFPLRHPSFVAIKDIHQGSMVLNVLMSSVALTYCYNRFARGFKRAKIGDELERLGFNMGSILGRVLSRINQRMQDFMVDCKENQSNIKSIEVRKGDKKEDVPKPEPPIK